MAEKSSDAVIQRLTNLTFALLGSSRPRDYEWIQKNVEGYENRSDEAFKRMVARDVQSIRRAGVPARHRDGEVWVDKDAYQLPAIEFTDEEAAVLGLAGDLGGAGSLGAFARSGWTKIAAGGATRRFDDAPVAALDNDIVRLDTDVLTAVTACVRSKTRIRFAYYPSPTTNPQTRTMDPWGIVALNNKAYVVGWDVDREAERSFRAIRVRDVKKVKSDSFVNPTRSLQEIVEDSLRGPTVDAVLSIEPGAGRELTEKAFKEDSGTYWLRDVERDWLVRTVVSFAPNVKVVEPKDVAQDVVALLRAAEEGHSGS
ncbi:helix-turn-helix transcriptional regulator [Corynebacterium aquatimens]|uniref:Proteasome accessory factor B n=1 Tax=Corynebacterium aquatimens TaxID=1190508 RepID=A0A931DZK3_9CORY|nr:WYL domain-containing protein [Corynebacterium aquatimens]MBG6121583.1 proteasome accessory factor B [Corynebacterium aquatimens]WJY65877.1 hypothetical protein CAQUA_05850 [Corynebacterium aquatimens]